MQRKFAATAVNDAGLRFQFTFMNVGWHSIESVAAIALDNVVANDPMHRKLAPWRVTNIRIAA